ncbi:MAG: stage III sporulation protein AF, partial [Bacillota bacterium]|nr:stage III sporulation protein AF [Bacillota bacterium]
FILIIAIINPFISLLSKGIDIKDFQLADSNILDQKELEEQSKLVDEKQKQQIIQVYKDKLNKKIEESLNDIEGISAVTSSVTINEDYNSENFGALEKVVLEISQSDGKSDVVPVSKVDKIEVREGDTPKEASVQSGQKEISGKLKEQVETKLNKVFQLDKESILITTAD